jgi:hypothetical protein
MSKVIYLITSHTLPTQVIRLIHTLRQLSPDSIIAIHHDQSKSTLLEEYITFPHFSYYYRIPILIQNTITKTLSLINKSGILNIIIAATKSKNKIGIKHINAPFNDQLICYGGPDWFNLNKKCIAKILSTETENNSLLGYYKTTHIPSESFIHTLLINDSKLKISNNSMRFVNWTERYSSSPSIICSSDYERIIRSKMPFARKFDMTIDNNILDKIDRHLGITN